MSDKDLARRTDAEVYFDGVNISASCVNTFVITFTDEGKTAQTTCR